jgi:hypothetical protein
MQKRLRITHLEQNWLVSNNINLLCLIVSVIIVVGHHHGSS